MERAEITTVTKALAKRDRGVEASIVKAELVDAVKACPPCGCKKLLSASSKGGRRRFRSTGAASGKSFNALTGTPLAGMHAPKISSPTHGT